MIELTPISPYLIAFLVFTALATGLAVAILARLAVEATRKPRSRPVVLITTDRVPAQSAAA